MILPITSYAPLVTKNDHQDNHFLGKWTSLCICFIPINLFSKILLSFGELQGHFQPNTGNPPRNGVAPRNSAILPWLRTAMLGLYTCPMKDPRAWKVSQATESTARPWRTTWVSKLEKYQGAIWSSSSFIIINHRSSSLMIIHLLHHHQQQQKHVLLFRSTVDILLTSPNFRGQETVEPSSPQSQCVASCTLGRHHPCHGN